jgi:2-polyprenyl-3-methyl-5-hydroxy-6-metoxy-1,4-benzoquinol methylase
MFSLSLVERRFRPELMDQPELRVDMHREALTGLSRLNHIGGIARQLWRPMREFANMKRKKTLDLLDIASGGGDISLALWKLARCDHIELRILGLDISATACQHAAVHCHSAGGAIRFRQADVTARALPTGFDIVTCSLFLHHLTPKQVPVLLRNMAKAGQLLVVNDLKRCRAGYVLAQAACRLLTTSRVVWSDGPQSVLNAFTMRELRELTKAAGILDATVRPSWPFRMTLIRKGRR